MATYYDKKKLLDENKDLYISEYDKSLGYNALSGIIQAKKDYAAAEKNNDSAAKQKANATANNIRSASGSYTAGTDGSEYNPLPSTVENRSTTGYTSSYKTQIADTLKSILKENQFSYNPEDDPVYQSYRKIYTKLGNDAYDRALAQNSLRTGGMLNTSAASAALQAQNSYNSKLSEIIPKLYESAYKRYSDDYDRLYKSLNLLSDLENDEYSRYRDSVKDFESDRDYFYKKYRDNTDDFNSIYRFDTNTQYKLDKSDYTKSRDEVKDQQWKYEIDSKNDMDMITLLANLAKTIYGKKAWNNDAYPYLEILKKYYQ